MHKLINRISMACVLVGVMTIAGCGSRTGKIATITETVVTNESNENNTTLGVSSETTSEDVLVENNIDDDVLELMTQMTLEEKTASLFMVDCPEKKPAVFVKKYKPGGFVLAKDDFDGYTKDDIIYNISNYQSNSTIPMFIGVDEEGGEQVSISGNKSIRKKPFATPRKLLENGGIEEIIKETREKDSLLTGLGVNVNFSPVCDLAYNSSDDMYDRTVGDSPESCAQYVEQVVKIGNELNVGSVLSHFPGYGSNDILPESVVRDDRQTDVFETSDLIPFKRGIQAGAGMIMVTNNIIICMDPDKPASISVAVHNILRDNMEYNGVIITDKLTTAKIGRFSKTPAVDAIIAGTDMIYSDDFITQYESVISAVKDGTITEERINESVARILTLKKKLNII